MFVLGPFRIYLKPYGAGLGIPNANHYRFRAVCEDAGNEIGQLIMSRSTFTPEVPEDIRTRGIPEEISCLLVREEVRDPPAVLSLGAGEFSALACV